MSDFRDALKAKLARNAQLEQERADAEKEMDAAAERVREQEEQRQRELAEARELRHAELVEHLQQLVAQLAETDAGSFVSRDWWSRSGEEFVAKLQTIGMIPARTLSIELDRDDDEVLARWHSDRGDAMELYHLLEVTPEMLSELVLQLVDQELWRNLTTPAPPFPGNVY